MQLIARTLTRPLVLVVPPSLTIWQAASPPSSQGFVLAGLVVLLPAILGYSYWSYRAFKGKVSADAGYH